MKVLFVCRGNVARSQMGAALYNKLTNSHDADSAGTQVGTVYENERLTDRKARIGSSFAVDVMQKHGLHPERMFQTQLTKEMLPKYDLIISMAGKRYTPAWLAKAPNYRFWKVNDPKGRGYEITEKTLQKIEAKVRELIK